jgi:lysophospholipase L1-like esterase
MGSLVAIVLASSGLLLEAPTDQATTASAVDCARRYLAGGDHLPAGHEVSDTEKYPKQLLDDHLSKWGPWCVYNTSSNGTTSSSYISGGQLARSWNLAADLVTIQVGGENSGIVDLVDSCFDKVKDHDFIGANVCAAQVLGNQSAFTALQGNLTTILQQYRILAARNPNIVIAVLGYPNPYPDAISVTPKIAELCVPLMDTIATCGIRWAMLPPALVTLDLAIKKLNSSIKDDVAKFQLAANGQRFVYVDTYDKLRDHCMKMEVTIKTQVEHPEEDGVVHEHDSPAVNFGCSTNWFVEGSDGTATPDYLDPAAPGVLIEKSQTTSGMGIHPNADGANCISDLIFEADTIEPGVTPLKWKLRIPEAPKTDICQ